MNNLQEAMMWIFLLTFIIPVSLGFWAFSLRLNTYYASVHPVSPWRFLIAFLLPIYFTRNGLDRKSLDVSGAIAAMVVGFVMTISNYCFCAALIAFFVTGSKVTKYRAARKRQIDPDYREGGQRNWQQVICNGGIATELAIIFMLDNGSREQLLDFSHSYTSTWLCLSVLSVIACNCGDTWASEIGSVFGMSQPRHILTFNKVPIGTNGGISVAGTISSFLGGASVGLAYYITQLMTHTARELGYAPPQWPIIIAGGAAGLVGSMIDSILGATLQYSGFREDRGVVTDIPTSRSTKISGIPVLDNNGVNLFSALITGLIMPEILFNYWPH